YELNKDVRAQNLDDYDLTVTGAYNFGVVRVAAVYERLKYDVLSGGDLKRDLWGISGTIPMGPGTWYISWQRANDGKGSAADGSRVGGLGKGSDTNAHHGGITQTQY